MKFKTLRKTLLVLTLLGVVAAYFAFDLGQVFNLQSLKKQQALIQLYYEASPAIVLGLYFAAYVLVTAVSLPGAAVLTLAAGALFGLTIGTVVASFASTVGATLAFLAARFLFHDVVQAKVGERLQAVNRGIQKDGSFYLFTLRLIPVIPFFVVNLVMALTPIRTGTFYLVSQIGMLPGTIVYVNAGTQLARIESLEDVLSPGVIMAFALLALFPLVARRLIGKFRQLPSESTGSSSSSKKEI